MTITDGQTLVVYDAYQHTKSEATTAFNSVYLQVEINNTATSYEPYKGQSKTVTLPHTVYGAGVGVTSGSGKETQVTKNLSTLTGNWSSDAPTGDYIRFVMAIAGKANGYDLMCSSLKVSQSIIPATPTEEAISGFTSNNAIYIGLLVSRLSGDMSTAMGRSDAFKAYLQDNDIQIVYPLATPTDLSTTPTDLTLYNGDNVISSDGQIDLSYVQDMATVIRKIENQL